MLLKALNDFISTDQIDEHLKMTLQEDLTSMAPGIIIQVRIKRHSVKHGRRPTVRRWSEQQSVAVVTAVILTSFTWPGFI